MHILVGILVTLAVIIGGFFAFNSYIYHEKQADAPTDRPVNPPPESAGTGRGGTNPSNTNPEGSTGITAPENLKGTFLEGTRWSWKQSVLTDGEKVVAPSGDRFVLSFANGQANSTTDCNSMSSTYTATETKLNFAPFATTMMACENSQESVYAAHLALVERYRIEGAVLYLTMKTGTMEFTRR
jgi:heat shock protein HslJ